jgi:hypothetical protein
LQVSEKYILTGQDLGTRLDLPWAGQTQIASVLEGGFKPP